MINNISSVEAKVNNIIDGAFMKHEINSIESAMPLLYVLCAYGKGCYPSIVSQKKNEIFARTQRRISPDYEDYSEILRRIRNSVSEDYFSGVFANAADSLFQGLLKVADVDTMKKVYPAAVDHFYTKVVEMFGKNSGMYITPIGITDIIAQILSKRGCKNIYNPFAGSCSIAASEHTRNCSFYCQELSDMLALLGTIRLDAHNSTSSVVREDSLHTLSYEKSDFDAIIADLPFGIPANCEIGGRCARKIEEYPFLVALDNNSPEYGVYLVPPAVCYTGGHLHQDRKEVVDRNLIEAVIQLPSRILPHSALAPCIMVVNKRKEVDTTLFIDASSIIIPKDHTRTLSVDAEAIVRLFEDGNGEHVARVSQKTIKENDYDLSPYIYTMQKPELESGDEFMRLDKVISRIRPNRVEGEKKGVLITAQDLHVNHADIFTSTIDKAPEPLPGRNLQMVAEPCIITTPMLGSFIIKHDDTPVYMSSTFECFKVSDRISPEYSVIALTEAVKSIGGISVGMMSTFFRIMAVKVVIPSPEKQQAVVDAIKEKESAALNAKRQKLANMHVFRDSSADLLHDLGITFNKMSAAVSLLATEDTETAQSLRENIRFALRRIETAGADFSKSKPEIKKVDIVELLAKYIENWPVFGFTSFRIAPFNTGNISKLKCEIDEKLFYIMLDCILTNAHQHGFAKWLKDENMVTVSLSPVRLPDDETDYIKLSIGNNGQPFPADFTVEKFAERGYVGKTSAHSGLGGDHVCKIAHMFGGKISVESSEKWSYVNILLPIYLSYDNLEFEEYGENCL